MQLDLEQLEFEKLFEAAVRLKFDEDDDVPGEYFASPFLGRALSAMLATIIASAEVTGDRRAVEDWRRWRDWANHQWERRIVVRRVASWPVWGDMSHEARADALRACAAPFSLSEPDVDALIAEVEAARA